MRLISSVSDRVVCDETCVFHRILALIWGEMGHWGLTMFGDNRIAGGVLKGELSWWKIGYE